MATRGTKSRRRHRADLTGFTITFAGSDDPEDRAEACRALARAFIRWRQRRLAARAEKEESRK